MTFLLITLASCGSDYNSNYGDYSKYGPIEGIDSSTPDGARLLAAYRVMQGQCFSCHAGYADYKSSAAWVASGSSRVVAGSPTSSTIFTKLLNNGGTMPLNGSQLSADDVAAIEAWITGI